MYGIDACLIFPTLTLLAYTAASEVLSVRHIQCQFYMQLTKAPFMSVSIRQPILFQFTMSLHLWIIWMEKLRFVLFLFFVEFVRLCLKMSIGEAYSHSRRYDTRLSIWFERFTGIRCFYSIWIFNVFGFPTLDQIEKSTPFFANHCKVKGIAVGNGIRWKQFGRNRKIWWNSLELKWWKKAATHDTPTPLHTHYIWDYGNDKAYLACLMSLLLRLMSFLCGSNSQKA